MVGLVMKHFLETIHVRPKACSRCDAVMLEMNLVGPAKVREQIDYFTDRMHDNLQHYVHTEDKLWERPAKAAIRTTILACCRRAAIVERKQNKNASQSSPTE